MTHLSSRHKFQTIYCGHASNYQLALQGFCSTIYLYQACATGDQSETQAVYFLVLRNVGVLFEGDSRHTQGKPRSSYIIVCDLSPRVP